MERVTEDQETQRKMSTANCKRLLIRYLLCWGVLLGSLVLFPTLAWLLQTLRWMPAAVLQVLLLWPQYLFLPNGLSHEAALGQGTLAHGSAIIGAAAFWLAVIGGYVWGTRRLGSRVVYAALLPSVLLVLQLALYGLGVFGFGVVLAGP
jgi:hypothetical protein